MMLLLATLACVASPPHAFELLAQPALKADLEASARADVVALSHKASWPAHNPSVGSRGAVIIDPDEPGERWTGLQMYEAKKKDHKKGARGGLVKFNHRLLVRQPSVAVDKKGTATVSWEAARKVPGASLSAGLWLDQDVVARPRLRRESTGKGGKTGVVRLKLPGLFKERYRPSGRPEQHIIWRLELFDPLIMSTRVHEARLSVRCDPEPCGDESTWTQLPTITHGPVVDMNGPGGAVISFDTDVATVGVVAADGRLFRSATAATRHEIALTGLKPSQRYAYRAFVADERDEISWSRKASFKTSPTSDSAERFTIAISSDSRSGHGTADERFGGVNRKVLTELMTQALRSSAELVVFVGDLCDGYTTAPGDLKYQLDAWRHVTAPFAAFIPIYEGMGNHETVSQVWKPGWVLGRSDKDSAESIFAGRFVNPQNGPVSKAGAPTYSENVYSFDHGPVHVAMVNTNYWYRSHPGRADHPKGDAGFREGWVNDEQLAWLEKDLADAGARGQKHLLVATHEPAFPNGGHPKDAMYWSGKIPEVLAQRDRFVNILSAAGVKALFTGDEHNYSRTLVDGKVVKGMKGSFVQVITGGAGAPWYVPWLPACWACGRPCFFRNRTRTIQST